MHCLLVQADWVAALTWKSACPGVLAMSFTFSDVTKIQGQGEMRIWVKFDWPAGLLTS